MNKISEQIGNKIKELRKLRHLSREQIARKVGVSQQQIHRYETGINNIPIENLKEIARIFEKTIDYFLD